MNIHDSMTDKHETQTKKDPKQKHRLGKVSKIIVLEGLNMFDGKCYGYVNTLLKHINSYK